MLSFENSKVIFACKTGAELFCENCRDKDVIVIVDKLPSDFQKTKENGYDVFVYSYDAFTKQIEFNDTNLSLFNICFEVTKSDGVLYGEFPIKGWSWFDHKKEALQACLDYGQLNYFNPSVSSTNSTCPKRMIWALATYFAILNNSTDFTEEQKGIMQKCHDLELEEPYRWKLKTEMENLLRQL